MITLSASAGLFSGWIAGYSRVCCRLARPKMPFVSFALALLCHPLEVRLYSLVAFVVPALLVLVGCAADRELPPSSVIGQPIKFPEKLNAVAVGAGAVWVKGTNHLYRVDPQQKVIKATIPLGRGHDAYQELAVTENAVWAVNSVDNSISRVDPRTNAVVATIPVGRIPDMRGRVGTYSRFSRVWIGEGAVWVLNDREGTMTRVDPGRNEVIATIPLGFRHPRPRSVIIAEGAVWVAQSGQFVTRGLTSQLVEGNLLQIDTGTNRVVATIALVHPGPEAPGRGAYVALGEGAAWALYWEGVSDSVLSRIDLRTQKETATVPLGGLSSGVLSMALTIGEGAIWVLQIVSPGGFGERPSAGTLLRIDPRTHQVVARIPLSEHTWAPWAVTTRDGAVWVFRQDLLSRIDPGTNTVVGTVRVGAWWDGFAWGDNVLWVIHSRVFGDELYAYKLP